MKLYLFGGAEASLNQIVPEIKLIGEVINELRPPQVLHIPFARTDSAESEWSGDWFNKHISLASTTYLNAANEADIAQADAPLIFISGGSEHVNLYEKITADPKLSELITKTDYIIGESAGAMILGQHQRSGRFDGPSRLIAGLGIIKDTIIVAHYTERNLQESMRQAMKESGARYGLGIDCMTAAVFELDKFPAEFSTIGTGSVYLEKA